MAHHELDCRGMKCPMPMVKLFKKNNTIDVGDTLEMIADDPAFLQDIKAWCEQTGNELVEVNTKGNETWVRIKKMKEST